MRARLVLRPLFVIEERGTVRATSGLFLISSRRAKMASSSSRPLVPLKGVICSSNHRLDLLSIVDAHDEGNVCQLLRTNPHFAAGAIEQPFWHYTHPMCAPWGGKHQRTKGPSTLHHDGDGIMFKQPWVRLALPHGSPGLVPPVGPHI